MKRTLLIAVWAIGLMSDSAIALTLNEARSQGRVGETLNGYLVALQTDAETQALVKDINEARNHSYQQLAKQNNVSTKEIAKLDKSLLLARSRGNMFRELMVNGCANKL